MISEAVFLSRQEEKVAALALEIHIFAVVYGVCIRNNQTFLCLTENMRQLDRGKAVAFDYIIEKIGRAHV